MAYELCTFLQWLGGRKYFQSRCPIHLHSQSLLLSDACSSSCWWRLRCISCHLPGQGVLPSQPAGLFAGTHAHLGFGSGQILSWRGSRQCWRLPSHPCMLDLCSWRSVWYVPTGACWKREPFRPAVTVVTAIFLLVKPDAGSNRNKYMQHFAHFLRLMCSKKTSFSSFPLPCCPQTKVEGHKRTYIFKGISGSDCGHPTISNENVLLGDLEPRFGDCTEVQISLSRASKNYRFLSVPCPNIRSFEACPGLLGRRSAGLRSEPQGESFESWTRESSVC